MKTLPFLPQLEPKATLINIICHLKKNSRHVKYNRECRNYTIMNLYTHQRHNYYNNYNYNTRCQLGSGENGSLRHISYLSAELKHYMSEAGVTAGAAAQATELRKHEANDVKCSELGWLCIPLVVESYGARWKEAMESFSSLASRLAITSSRPKSAVLSELLWPAQSEPSKGQCEGYNVQILPSRLFLMCYLVLVMFSCILYVLNCIF